MEITIVKFPLNITINTIQILTAKILLMENLLPPMDSVNFVHVIKNSKCFNWPTLDLAVKQNMMKKLKNLSEFFYELVLQVYFNKSSIFRQKLEESYQLCSQCQRHLNRTLNRVKTKFIGSKMNQLKAKSLKSLNKTTKIITDEGRFISTIIILSILVLSIVNFQRDMNIELPPTDFNDSIHAIYSHFNAFLFTLGEILMNFVNEWELTEWIKDVSIDNVAASALVLNLILMIWDYKKIRVQIVLSMISWAAKMISNEVTIDESYAMTVKGSIASLLVISSLSILIKLWRKGKENILINKDTSFHKITNDICEDSDNECEISDGNSFYDWQSSRNAHYTSPHISKIMNGSFCSRASYVTAAQNFTNSSPKSIDVLNKSFNITKEVNSADRKKLQSDITRLTLGDKLDETFSTSTTIRDFNSTINPFSIAKNRSTSPSPSVASFFTSASQRNLISPPRLHSPQVYQNDTTTSWVAGGYWTSPQKKFIVEPSKSVLSRSSSSSQSSGLGDSEKNSRENSLAQEEMFSSIFSDKPSNLYKPNTFGKPQVRSLFENSFFPSNQSIGGGGSSSFKHFKYGNNNFNKYRDSNGFL